MYKVFVNDIPIILSTEKEIGNNYKSIPLKKAKLKRIIKKMINGEFIYVNLYHKKEEKLLKFLKKKLPVIVAGGGLVYNPKKEILFIYRNGKWDLPKGKIEKGEDIQTCAVREVEEETGVTGIEIKKFITRTYHVFKRNDKYRLKETYWYEMYTDFDGPLIPQENEGIKKVKWKDFQKTQEALEKSYNNIKLLFPAAYLTKHPNDRIA